jgi:hypothetical protein
MNEFFTGYRRTKLGSVIEKIVAPLKESQDREVVR